MRKYKKLIFYLLIDGLFLAAIFFFGHLGYFKNIQDSLLGSIGIIIIVFLSLPFIFLGGWLLIYIGVSIIVLTFMFLEKIKEIIEEIIEGIIYQIQCFLQYIINKVENSNIIRIWEKNHPNLKFCKNCSGNGTILVKKLIREAIVVKEKYSYMTPTSDEAFDRYIGPSGDYYGHLVEDFRTKVIEPEIYEDIIESCKYCNGLGGIPKDKKGTTQKRRRVSDKHQNRLVLSCG